MSGYPATTLALVALALLAGCAPSAKQAAMEPIAAPTTEKAPKPVEPPADSPKRPARPSLDELLLFYLAKYPEGDWNPRGLQYEEVWFNAADGTRLHGWYCPADHPRAVVLFAHSNGGNLSHRAALLRKLQNELRLTVLIFDYRGYGRSEGTPSVEGVLQDARAARRELADRAGVRETQLVLMGRSLGGAVVVQLAVETPPRGLILQSSFSSLEDVAAHHYPALAWLAPAAKLNSAARIAQYKGPLLQSHGDADRTIPYALGRKLFEAAREPKRFVTIPGGDHNDPQTEEYYRQVNEFLDALPGA
jgi:fermentation-respiration switch protein FrsA (DUF1100 family)